MMRRDERNAFTDEDGDDVNDELIDFARVEKRGDNPAAAHHHNILAFLRAQTFGECLDRFFDEFKTPRNLSRRLIGESIVLNATSVRRVFTFFLKAHHHVVSFSSPQNRVDRLEECAHAVIAGGAWTIQPINRAISARDISVSAGGDVDDDLSHNGVQSTDFSRPFYRIVTIILYLEVPFDCLGRETVIK